jgi:aspartate/methionine/tyrosine aminotransferase
LWIAQAVFAPCLPEDLTPDMSVLPSLITPRTKAIVLISPNNPTGAVTPPETIQKIQQLCQDKGTFPCVIIYYYSILLLLNYFSKGLWLIADEAYEDFVFDDATHYSPTGPNVINIFTFSKSYGMAGWRVGYVLFPPELKGWSSLFLSLFFFSCSLIIGKWASRRHGQGAGHGPHQRVPDLAAAGTASRHKGRSLVGGRLGGHTKAEQVDMHTLPQEPQLTTVPALIGREFVWDALEPLRARPAEPSGGPGTVRTHGSLYVFARLPDGVDDMAAVRFLSQHHKVCVLPGKGTRFPHIRRKRVRSPRAGAHA